MMIDPSIQLLQTTGTLLSASAIAAAIALFPALGSAIGQGFAAGKAAEAVGRNPEASGQITTTMVIGSAIAETSGIYGLLIAFILIFANPFVGILTQIFPY